MRLTMGWVFALRLLTEGVQAAPLEHDSGGEVPAIIDAKVAPAVMDTPKARERQRTLPTVRVRGALR